MYPNIYIWIEMNKNSHFVLMIFLDIWLKFALHIDGRGVLLCFLSGPQIHILKFIEIPLRLFFYQRVLKKKEELCRFLMVGIINKPV